MFTCIYEKSQHYKKAKVSPVLIELPIGYQSLYGNSEKVQSNDQNYRPNKEKLHLKDTTGYNIVVFNNKNPYRTLMHYRYEKLYPSTLIRDYFKPSQLQRKNQYLSGPTLQYIRKQITDQLIWEMNQHYFPILDKNVFNQQQRSVIEVSQLLQTHLSDHFFQLENYAVSKYVVAIEQSNLDRISFIYDFLNRKLLGYQLQIVRINHQGESIPQQNQRRLPVNNYEGPKNYASLKQILELTNTITKMNKQKDVLYDGVNFYFADHSQIMKRYYNLPFLNRELSHLATFQYFLLMLTGMLAPNQSAILRIEGAFKHKTIEYIYFLNLMFDGRITVTKPLGSNLFLTDFYILCENYNKQVGQVVRQYLILNFGTLFGAPSRQPKQFEQFLQQQKQSQHSLPFELFDGLKSVKKGDEYLHIKEENLLIDIRRIIKDDFPSISQFNDTLIHRGYQSNVNQFKKNSKVLYYPDKKKIIEKLEQKHCKLIDGYLMHIKQPDHNPQQMKVEEQKTKKNEQNFKKEADFQLLSGLISHQPKRHHKTEQKSKKKEGQNRRQRQKEGAQKPQEGFMSFLQKLENHNQQAKQKKTKSKKKKEER